MTKVYHADLFDHRSQLVLKLETPDWPTLKQYIDDELPIGDIDMGFTIVVYVNKQ